MTKIQSTLAPDQANAQLVTDANWDTVLRGTPFFFRLACRVLQKLQVGTIVFILPNGKLIKFQGSEETDSTGVIKIHHFDFARRVIFKGDIGFYESFADDQWDTPDLAQCLYIIARNADHFTEFFESIPVFAWVDKMRHAMNRNTHAGSKRNIMAHYDLGNAFYEKWLDRTMTYSSARFPTTEANLAEAQRNKYFTLTQSISLKPDDRVLEIGSGWGGFAEFAAKDVGANVTGLTLSKEQLNFAQERIFREGLAEKVDFRLQDYRDVEGQFDKIASIEMFEAVGKEYWSSYFHQVRDCLKPGGTAGFQIITIADRFFDHYMKSPDFIQRYVFPGGMLPSVPVLKKQIESAGLAWREAAEFGQDYARTLNEWCERFLDAWDDIEPLGFDDKFKKLWRFYLAYCEAGFRAKTTDVMQVSVSR